jgi:hypothetical protein
MGGLDLRVIETPLALCKLPSAADIPPWAAEAPFVIAVRTLEELTIVVSNRRVPDVTKASRNWRAVAVKGPIEHGETGVLLSLVAPLAEASVPVFSVSTYSTDYLLVPGDQLEAAIAALEGGGHTVDVS